MPLSKGKYYLFANWKMYLDYNESNILANALAGAAKKFPDNIKMAVFPSALSLYPVAQVLHDVGVGVGSQNIFWEDKGGYTGEVSAMMYKEAGCDYALVGHSERRHQFHETNHEVRLKLEAVLSVGLTPILCVGETADEREKGKTEEIVEIQLRAALDGLSFASDKEFIVAYEPVWAIGTGLACDALEAERLHVLIKKIVSSLLPEAKPIILYGGSVRPENVVEYLKQEDVSGVLVGGASAKLDSWLEIVENSVI